METRTHCRRIRCGFYQLASHFSLLILTQFDDKQDLSHVQFAAPVIYQTSGCDGKENLMGRKALQKVGASISDAEMVRCLNIFLIGTDAPST